jgi:ABC-2 type transport system permease protein
MTVRSTGMSEVQRIGLIARREVIEYARQPSYRNGTIITSVLIVAAVAAYSLLPMLFGGPDEVTFGVLPDGEALVDAAVLQGADRLEATSVPIADEASGRAALAEGDIDVLVVDSGRVVVQQELGGGVALVLQEAATTVRLADTFGADPAEVLAGAQQPIGIDVVEPPDPQATQRQVMTLVGVFLAIGQVVGGAFVLANGMVEEKSSRVVEIIVAKARPRSLLTGKIVGLYGVLTLQLLVFVVVGFVAVAVSPDLAVPSGLPAVVLSVLAWYTLAFVIFGALFSIAAAVSARQEDMVLKIQPMMYLVFAAFGGAFYSAGNPDSLLTRILSFVPFTAPTVLPARQASGSVALWEIAVAVAVMAITAWAALTIAGRAYSGGALRTRGTSTIRETLADAE